ncbi:MAG: hypothetical protein JJT82_06350 [Legionellaceae bacterium]|nr:hypothetical protein [Legionellaceae bacterium]
MTKLFAGKVALSAHVVLILLFLSVIHDIICQYTLLSGLILDVDDRNNIIAVCLFESYLAKYMIEHPEIFDTILEKIADTLEKIISIHTQDRHFDRTLFSVFSILAEQQKEIKNFSALKTSRSLIAWDTFLKYFVERRLHQVESTMLQVSSDTSDVSADTLSHFSLFSGSYQRLTSFGDRMRPEALFSETNRGVVERKQVDDYTTDLSHQ